MARLEGIPVEELEAELAEATGKRETRRLLVAIIYKRGPSVPMIAEWLDIREATIYSWFDRLEAEPISEAVSDRDRPGRPSKLTESQRERFREAMQRPPAEVGYDEPEWSPTLAQQYLDDEFGIDYSRRHVQRLLDDV